MRDQDEETRPLRFGARRDDKPSLWQQERDREDAYWCPPQAACIKCGAVDDLPRGVEYDEYLCSTCEQEELAEAENYLQHMSEQSERK